MNLTRLLVPTLTNQVAATVGWLDKAEAFAAERGEGADALLSLRLAPDMYPLVSQLRFVAFQAGEAVARLRGEEPSADLLAVRAEGWAGRETPGTVAQARARLTETLSMLAAVGADELDAAAERPLAHALPMGHVFDMTGETYVRDWALPQVAFHQLMAYAILRQAGVPLGKVDYVSHMWAYLRPGTAPGPAAG